MEQVELKINIYDLAAKYLNLRRDKKVDVIFNLLNLKNYGFINNTPLIKFAGLLDIDPQLLKDKISSVKNDDDIFPLMAKYKMMAKYEMISPENIEILKEHANFKIENIYKNMDFAKQQRIFSKNISDIQLN